MNLTIQLFNLLQLKICHEKNDIAKAVPESTLGSLGANSVSEHLRLALMDGQLRLLIWMKLKWLESFEFSNILRISRGQDHIWWRMNSESYFVSCLDSRNVGRRARTFIPYHLYFSVVSFSFQFPCVKSRIAWQSKSALSTLDVQKDTLLQALSIKLDTPQHENDWKTLTSQQEHSDQHGAPDSVQLVQISML